MDSNNNLQQYKLTKLIETVENFSSNSFLISF